ncbi:Sulfide dehydrogenase [flavocytochrome c] flavoprotein chain precursor [Planctopirus ephydatiae]|uniref:Sulfide dehydrogenase [flavocytochrome c] flavoprotein chain n=1 Tax=Planctopirus ephydatiae TaxID=2528019 RepID=A0A518GTF7_9PLAN|nr:FAD/NAD(P)-binding oxidoreductase [Planctopirus ephydatiae]QDV31849.1 Sulfide dehydrogenase [flavocytochrome c] flavoprotein chain precursor [Planctopirus ephydatiae]
MSETIHHQIVIVGGGTAGITVAAQLTRGWFNSRDVAVIEPSDKHYYQPLWTMVGAGLAKKEATEHTEASVIPRGVTWIRDAVSEFLPEQNTIRTQDGKTVTYDWLVVAAGLQVNWDQIPGLRESIGKHGVCSNYSYSTVDSTWEAIRNFRGGNAVFTNPSGAVKCGGAPQKIMYLADDRFREAGVRDKTKIIYASALQNIFAVEKYRATLLKVIARKQIECRFRHELVAIRAESQEADFINLETQETVTIPFDLLHVTPPMGPPGFIARSAIADKQGWVEIDKDSLRHVRFANVFALGDCSNLPTSKTGAAIRKQAPVVVKNLLAAMQGQPLSTKYDGYTSCPVVTGIGKLVLAEFDYDKQPAETFPVDQSKERWSMWILKRYLLPVFYWHGMLKGRM